jgi:HlyD family secretion protein
MSKRMRWSLVGVVVVGAGIYIATTAAKRNSKATEVRIEAVQKRDLVASVTASGQVQPHTKVDVASDISGRIVRLSVKEGDIVRRGQFLLQIDPAQYQAEVQRADAALSAAKAQAAQAKANLIQAQRNYDRSMEIRKTNAQLVSEEQIEQLKTQVEVNQALFESASHNVEQSEASLEDARSRLAKTTILAPMSGKVTRLVVEQGETAVPGTFNKDAATLLTIADMSVLETKVKVDETDVARISLGDSAVIQQLREEPQRRVVDGAGDRLRSDDPPLERAEGYAPGLLGHRQGRDGRADAGADDPDHLAHGARERGAGRRLGADPGPAGDEAGREDGRRGRLRRRRGQQSHLPTR